MNIRSRTPVTTSNPQRVVVAEELFGSKAQSDVCASPFYAAAANYRAVDPLGESCAEELSQYHRIGRLRMRSVYSSCPIQIVTADVPNDDLGVIANFRDVVKSLKHTKGSQRMLSASFASPTALSYPQAATEDLLPTVGIYVKLAFQLSLTQVAQVQIATSNVDPIMGGTSVTAPNRDITIQLDEGCVSVELFLPFAAKDMQSEVWAPRGALIQADNATASNNATITLTGLPASAGTAYGRFLSATDPLLSRFAGAINNNA